MYLSNNYIVIKFPNSYFIVKCFQHRICTLPRANIDENFKQMFKESEKMAKIVGITISIKRFSQRSKHRDNPSMENLTPETYYRVTIAIPYIDLFIQQLEAIFLCHKNIFKGFQCLFSGTYSENFDELYTKLNKHVKYPKNCLEELRQCDKEIFPNIHFLLKILCTLPVSTSTPERTFSCLKRLKSYLRNTMTDTRLNGLAMLAVHKEIPLTAEEVLNELSKKSRKLDFVL
ncbi:unnamed protein product [Macrosiphum euphorbiae]|uniref:HAT C-terminal dimerisation domain-containing protein n=1 Tax=Macrosiphum euphorbiae TaxID=13131 RepID=A0AAV0XUL7_9HEMI|nr:unnamed protein product [Macrosiphum euphorbiae]